MQDALVESWRRGGGAEPPDAALVFATIRRRAIDAARRTERRERREHAGAADELWFAPGELTFQQIADTVGIPLNTAASRYRYALERLRVALKEVRP